MENAARDAILAESLSSMSPKQSSSSDPSRRYLKGNSGCPLFFYLYLLTSSVVDSRLPLSTFSEKINLSLNCVMGGLNADGRDRDCRLDGRSRPVCQNACI